VAERALEAIGVSKSYRLGERVYPTLRDAIGSLSRRIARRDRASVERVWALDDVTFSVDRGEAVGIIGRNGAGKSTLLKILARITTPSAGVTRTRGRVGALLEVGTGFHPELTGRENIYFNAAVLGISRRAIRGRFDEIVAFSGVERFLDTPLKRYSSGMHLRLAFAVAAHVEPDIVVVDEVLAVGDADFQRKCLGRMQEFNTDGRTVLFVSHDLGAIARLCSRAIWIEGGRIRADGRSADVIAAYLNLRERRPDIQERMFPVRLDRPAQLGHARISVDGRSRRAPRRGDPLTAEFRLAVHEPTPGLDFALVLFNDRGVRVLDEAWSDVRPAAASLGEPGEYRIRITIPPLLAAGRYAVAAWIGRGSEELAYEDGALTFEVLPALHDSNGVTRRDRVVQPDLGWSVERIDGNVSKRVMP
jgi:ABC-type polysaccharide/polyol phosphate transport system ATPase subunit